MNQANEQHRSTTPIESVHTDADQFVAQYQKAYPKLAMLAAAIIGDRSHAEDIVQEAAIIAIEKLDEFQPGTSHTAWLAEIVRRCSYNHRRKTQNRRTYASDPDSLAQVAKDRDDATDSSPIAPGSGELLGNQTAFDDQVLRALQTLSDEARCCLLLRTIQKLSYAEISELMQLPEGTAMSHVHRSKATLRRLLHSKVNPSREET